MNSFIESLNQWGGNFLNLAWPMLWQSSLLIAFVFSLDLWLARKIRASIRYAVWLAVLVKLLLPPTLALPTSPAWWLFHGQPAIGNTSAQKYVVTYDSTAPQADFVPQMSPVRAPEPKLDGAGAVFLGSITVSSGLLVWLVFRWRQITRKVRGTTVSQECAGTLEAARQMAGSGSRVRLNIVESQMSPAVCGLFNPVILLPRTLVEKLSAGQLRAVLLHELFHLRRKDVWVNCAQALLQIVYWWHPLLWLANARIRRVREEAVDDAVMLALRDGAEDYAPTLLEVARLAFRRPRLSLGLVGIMESRSALRQRIERLVNFRAPRKAGLSLVSLCGIFVFSTVALPMGEAPSPAERQSSLTAVVPAAPVVAEETNPPSILISAHIYQMRAADFDKMVSALMFNPAVSGADPWWSASPEKFRQLTETLKSSGLQPINSPRIQTSSGIPAEIYVGNGTNGIDFTCTPFVVGGKVYLTIHGKVVDTTALGTVTNQFGSGTSVENRGGVVFRTANMDGNSESNLVVITGVELVTNLVTAGNLQAQSRAQHPRAVTFKVNHPLRQDELKEQLLAAGVEIPTTAYFYLDSGILLVRGSDEQLARVHRLVLKLNGFSAKAIAEADAGFVKDLSAASASDENESHLYSRTFKVSADVFNRALRNVPGLQTNNVSVTAYSLFSKLGVDLKPPESVFYNDRLGLLFVRASLPDLETIENVLSALNDSAPEIHIKARFLEVPKGTLDGLTKIIGSTNPPDQFGGILTSESAKMAMKALESRAGVEELAEPEVTTSSGRQTEMRATEIISVITNFIFAENSGTQSNSITPQVAKVEIGPILYTMATVLPDGYTVDLDAKASLTEFLGYDTPPDKPVEHINDLGDRVPVSLSVVLPSFGIRNASAHVKLLDGQTVVLGGMKKRFYVAGKKVGAEPDYFVKTKAARGQSDEEDKDVLVFITVTLVDSAGNRIHSEKDMPFARNAIPQQDGMR
jgi:beta-lactamase regulating signal transducer with metallopeptidase domain